MKKILICVLTLILAFTLVGCGGEKISADEAKALFNTANEKATATDSSFTFKMESEISTIIEGKMQMGAISMDLDSTSSAISTTEMAKDKDLLYLKSTSSMTKKSSEGDIEENSTSESYVEKEGIDISLYSKEKIGDKESNWSYSTISTSRFASLTEPDFDFENIISDWSFFEKSGNTIKITDKDAFDFSSMMGEEKMPEGVELDIDINTFKITFDDNGAFKKIDIDIKISYSVDYSDLGSGSLASAGSGKMKMAFNMKATGEYSKVGSTTVVIPDDVKAIKTAA